MRNLFKKRWLALGMAASFAFAMIGCGSGDAPDPKVETARVESASSLRALFTKANGDYASLSAADKAEFVKLCGGEANAEKTWNAMKFGPSGGGTP